jgi:hypothetical protein
MVHFIGNRWDNLVSPQSNCYQRKDWNLTVSWIYSTEYFIMNCDISFDWDFVLFYWGLVNKTYSSVKIIVYNTFVSLKYKSKFGLLWTIGKR